MNMWKILFWFGLGFFVLTPVFFFVFLQAQGIFDTPCQVFCCCDEEKGQETQEVMAEGQS